MDGSNRIKDMIRALMAKTVDNGCTEEEAMAASKKVQDLLNKYELSLSDIRLKEESKCTTGKYDVNVRTPGPLDFVISAIGYFTDTKPWREPKGGDDFRLAYKYFGLEHDVLIAEYVTKLCDWAIIYSGEDFKSSEIYMAAPNRAKVLLDFRNAMALRLAKRLRDMKDEQRKSNLSQGRDLVIVKSSIVSAEFEKLGMILKKGKSKNIRNVNAAAWSAGTAAGDKVNINPGVEGRKERSERLSYE